MPLTSLRATLGIAGGGQLARMMVPPAKRLGLDVIVLDPTPDAPAGQLADAQIVAPFDDAAALATLAARVDVITYDLEHVDLGALRRLKDAGRRLVPDPEVLAVLQDKGRQRAFFDAHGLPGPRFAIDDAPTAAGLAAFGFPLVQKVRTGGYDGRGVWMHDAPGEPVAPVPSLLEARVSLAMELGVMVARGADGEERTWPATELIADPVRHQLDVSLTPARVPPDVARAAEALAARAIRALGGVGVFGVELFLDAAGALLLNEIAPRPHNSGHYTIEAAVTDQFEQHVRAVMGLPLGSTELLRPAVTANLVGRGHGEARVVGLEAVLAMPGVAVHLYGKRAVRPGRKMGHLTVMDADLDAALARARAAQAAIWIEGSQA